MSWARKGKFHLLSHRGNLITNVRQVLDVRIGECSRSVNQTYEGSIKHVRPYSNGFNKPQYFHPSRPDFLPNSATIPMTSDEEGSQTDRSHQSETILYNYTPTGIWKTDNSALMEDDDLVELYASVNAEDWQKTWIEFTNLFGTGAQRQINEDVFDSIFWSIASEDIGKSQAINRSQAEEEEETVRCEVLFKKVSSIVELAKISNIDLTTLQTRRLVHIWLIWWELCHKKLMHRNEKFSYSSFLHDLDPMYGDLDQHLASRIVSQLSFIDEIEEAKEFIQKWQYIKSQNDTRRMENWKQVDTKSNPTPNSQMLADSGKVIESGALQHLLEACLRNCHIETYDEVAIFVLGHEGVIRDNPIIDQALLQYLPRNGLLSLLPHKVRHSLFDGVISNDPKVQSLQHFDEEERQRMFIPITKALTELGELSLVEWLLQAQIKSGSQNMPKGLSKVFAIAAIKCAQRSSNMEDFKVVQQIRRAINFLKACRHADLKFDANAHLTVIRSFKHIMRTKMLSMLLPLDEWRNLARELTIITLRDNECFSMDSDFTRVGIPALLSLHIKVEDYPYAKRLFTLYQDQYGRYTNRSPFSRTNYIWFLEECLKADPSVEMMVNLFDHWVVSDLSSDGNVPEFLPSHLRLIAKKLIKGKRGSEALSLLPLFDFESNPNKFTVKRLYKKGEARRTVVAFSHVPTRYFLSFLPFLEKLLKYLRTHQEGELDAHLIEMHLIVLHRYRFIIREGQANSLVLAQLFSVFQAIRQHALEVANISFNADNQGFKSELSSTLHKPLSILYRRGLRLMEDLLAIVEEEDTNQQKENEEKLASELKLMLKEMEQVWTIDLDSVDQDGTNSVISSCRIHTMIGLQNWQDAHKLFCGIMKNTTNEWQRYTQEEIREEKGPAGEQDRARAPRAPLPIHIATRLALSLGKANQFEYAREILSIHQRCLLFWVPPHQKNSKEDFDLDRGNINAESEVQTHDRIKGEVRLMIESTNVALLCMQNRMQEALDRIYSLERLGVFGSKPQPETPLLFSDQGKLKSNLTEFVEPKPKSLFPFNFNLTPTFGPSNAELCKIFISALHKVGPKVRIADWQGTLQKAQQQLADYTGVKMEKQPEEEEGLPKRTLGRWESIDTVGDRGDDSEYTNRNRD